MEVSIYVRFICEYDACPAIEWDLGISLKATGAELGRGERGHCYDYTAAR